MRAEPAPIQILTSFDVMRGIAILLVYLAHMTTVVPDPAVLGWVRDVLFFGGTGVQLFFVVSALTLWRSFQQRKTRETHFVSNFYVRRLFRILPAFYLALGFAFLLNPEVRPSAFDFIAHVLLVHGFFPQWGNSFLSVEWSISAEIFFYALAPYIFLKLENDRRKIVWITALSTLFAILADKFGLVYIYHPFFHFFAFGLSLLWFTSPRRPEKHEGKLFLFFMLTALLLFFIAPKVLRSSRLPPIFWTLMYCCLVGVSVSPAGNRFWESKAIGRALAFLGRLSFSFYLFHLQVIVAFRWLLKGYGTAWIESNLWVTYCLLNVAAFILTMGLSYLCFKWVERPLIDLGKRWLAEQTRQRNAKAPGLSKQVG